MRILHVCQNYFPSKGGPQYTMKHVSEKLAAFYHDDVSVFTTNSLYNPESPLFKKIEPAHEIINGVNINRYPFNRWHYPFIKYGNKVLIKLTGLRLPERFNDLRYGLDAPLIDKTMANADADVIMATTINYNFCNYPLWRFKTTKPKPFVLYGAIHLHQQITNENHPALIKARACDCYIANTDYEKDVLVGHGVNPGKIVSIGTGIEADEFKINNSQLQEFKTKHGIKENDAVIGFIGRLVKGKGVAILLDSFRRLCAEHKNLKLLLAGGTTEYVPEIKRIAAEENLPLILIEDFDDSLKPVLYHALDVFVLASQSESFGVVFLEAWACKKPVIGTNLGAVASVVSNKNDGLLFDRGNVDSLAEAINTLVKNNVLCKTLGQNGYLKTVGQYSWPAIVEKYRNAYLLGIDNFKREYKTNTTR
jgi:glycosyltransferase involved in cell wall biosynthesis